MHTQYKPNNYLSNLSLYIKLHRFIHHDKNWYEHKTKSNYTIWNIHEGNVWLEINGQVHKAGPGDVFFFYPGDTYKAYSDEAGCSFLFFIFSLQSGNNIDVLNSEHLSGFYHHTEVSRRSLEATGQYLEKYHGRECSTLKLYAFFLDYFADISAFTEYAIPFRAVQKNGDSLLIHKILNYMNAHYTENITVKELAEIASMSEKNFIRYFHFNVGISPKRYLIEQRMKYATELLADQETSITEIAQAVGYSDPYCFSKAFRKYYGESPTACRKSLALTNTLDERTPPYEPV